jgi:hypothetical protein
MAWDGYTDEDNMEAWAKITQGGHAQILKNPDSYSLSWDPSFTNKGEFVATRTVNDRGRPQIRHGECLGEIYAEADDIEILAEGTSFIQRIVAEVVPFLQQLHDVESLPYLFCKTGMFCGYEPHAIRSRKRCIEGTEDTCVIGPINEEWEDTQDTLPLKYSLYNYPPDFDINKTQILLFPQPYKITTLRRDENDVLIFDMDEIGRFTQPPILGFQVKVKGENQVVHGIKFHMFSTSSTSGTSGTSVGGRTMPFQIGKNTDYSTDDYDIFTLPKKLDKQNIAKYCMCMIFSKGTAGWEIIGDNLDGDSLEVFVILGKLAVQINGLIGLQYF